MTEMMSGALNVLWISSRANMTPVSGAWKAAAMPAPAPQVTRRRSSPLPRLRNRETPLPAMPPSCTDGPSRPSERPPMAPRVPSMNLAPITRCQGASMAPMTSASTCGMPEPDVAGSHRTRAATTTAITARAKNHSAAFSELLPNVAMTERSVFSPQVRARRYSVTRAPANRPTRAPSHTRLTWNLRERRLRMGLLRCCTSATSR